MHLWSPATDQEAEEAIPTHTVEITQIPVHSRRQRGGKMSRLFYLGLYIVPGDFIATNTQDEPASEALKY